MGLHLELAALDDLLDLLAVLGADAVAHLEHLLDLVAADLLDLAGVDEKRIVDVALGQLVLEDVVDLADLEVARRRRA